jgi:hypothetical protein
LLCTLCPDHPLTIPLAPSLALAHSQFPPADAHSPQAICTKCDTGYAVKASGRACYCAPGYYTTENTAVSGQTGFTCVPCDYNNVCPGAKITAESSTAFAACGANKITTTQFAKSDRECVVKPGFGWGSGDTSAACDAGFCESPPSALVSGVDKDVCVASVLRRALGWAPLLMTEVAPAGVKAACNAG